MATDFRNHLMNWGPPTARQPARSPHNALSPAGMPLSLPRYNPGVAAQPSTRFADSAAHQPDPVDAYDWRVARELTNMGSLSQRSERGTYDPLYDQQLADHFRANGEQGRVFPVPEYTPGYAYRDDIFIRPGNDAARGYYGFDRNTMSPEDYAFPDPTPPRLRRC